mmetsp:Transcript_10261/g.25382  ORF Transcript_10261/g.25382 Transcript_10261/m.25382 type:complete len:249 (+) Transcript_10261:512-1258(+)
MVAHRALHSRDVGRLGAQLAHLRRERQPDRVHLGDNRGVILLERADRAARLDEAVLLLVEVLEVAVGQRVLADVLEALDVLPQPCLVGERRLDVRAVRRHLARALRPLGLERRQRAERLEHLWRQRARLAPLGELLRTHAAAVHLVQQRRPLSTRHQRLERLPRCHVQHVRAAAAAELWQVEQLAHRAWRAARRAVRHHLVDGERHLLARAELEAVAREGGRRLDRAHRRLDCVAAEADIGRVVDVQR